MDIGFDRFSIVYKDTVLISFFQMPQKSFINIMTNVSVCYSMAYAAARAHNATKRKEKLQIKFNLIKFLMKTK